MEMSHAESRLTFSRKSSFKKLRIEMVSVSRCIHDCNIKDHNFVAQFKRLLFVDWGSSTGASQPGMALYSRGQSDATSTHVQKTI